MVARSDRKILDLLMNGVPFVPDTEITFEHGFAFSSKEEQLGIAAFLRTIQEKELDRLVELVLETDDLSVLGF